MAYDPLEYQKQRREQFFSWAISDEEGGLVMRDWLGKPYHRGSSVCYPHSPGQIIYMVRGIIAAIHIVGRNSNWDWERISLSTAREVPLGKELEWRVLVDPDLGSGGNPPERRCTITRIENITSLIFLYA